MGVRAVYFWLEKDGSTADEWEDGFDGTEGDPATNPRFAVADGATEAYDSLRWVAQVVESFVGRTATGAFDAPSIRPDTMRQWFEAMQQRWVDKGPVEFANLFEERKFHEDGSFATLLGCELTGLDGPAPRWDAVALGDTVLFHVRDCRLYKHFPDLSVEDFGLSPDGVHTKPEALDQMMEQLTFDSGDIRVGDRLYLATDAFAHWMLGRVRRDERELWTTLGRLDHDQEFARLVTQHRAAGEMHNDDVTLARLQVVGPGDPEHLVVCL